MSGPMPAGSPSVSASGLGTTLPGALIAAPLPLARTILGVRILGGGLPVFDHRGLADLGQIVVRHLLVFRRIHLVPRRLARGRVDRGRLAGTERHHLDALLGYLGRRRM